MQSNRLFSRPKLNLTGALRLALGLALVPATALADATASSSASSTSQNVTSLSAAAPVASKPWSLNWTIMMEADRSSDALSEQRSEFLLGVLIDFKMTLNPWMSADIAPRLISQNGYIQSPDAENPETSRIDIHNASLDLKPLPYMQVSAGSLNERDHDWHDPIFMRDLSFPAARVIGQTSEKGPWRVYAYAETAIPTSYSISNNSDDLNKTPSLNTAGLGLDLGSPRSKFESYTRVSYFNFENLPQTVMTASALLGNSSTPTSGSDYLLNYNFQGLEYFNHSRLRFANYWEAQAWAAGITNTQAPSGLNSGWRVGGGLQYQMQKDWSIMPSYTYFQIESDATLATYNYLFYNTNMAGSETSLKLSYQQKYDIVLGYEPRQPLVENPSQPAQESYWLNFTAKNLTF